MLSRAGGVLVRVPAVCALPLGLGGRLRILRTMYTPAGLHGDEASLVSQASLSRLRTAHVRAATSGEVLLANPGVLWSLLDGPEGCDPGYHVVWCRSRMLRRFVAYNAGVADLAGVYGSLRAVGAGAPGHGPIHLLVQSASVMFFAGILMLAYGFVMVSLVFVRLPALSRISGVLSLMLGMLRFSRSWAVVLNFGRGESVSWT